MKNLIKNTISITLLIFFNTNVNARTCDDYITDEWPDSRYIINTADGVVSDKKTELMWKRCSVGTSGTNCETGVASFRTWQQALLIQETANSANFAGFNDWRLPNVEELRSIAALNCFDPAINENAFPNTPIYWFWSSSPIAQNDAFAWDVYFGKGNDTGNNRTVDLNVRLVRTAP
jgi:hypothetical protein